MIKLICKTIYYGDSGTSQHIDLIPGKMYLCKSLSVLNSWMMYYSIHDSNGNDLHSMYVVKFAQYGACYFYTEEESAQILREDKLKLLLKC
jgi:hypothetical protein